MLADAEMSKHRVSCGEGLCVLWPFTNLTHPYIKGLEMVYIISKTQCLIFFLLLHSATELPVVPEVSGHCKNALTPDMIFWWLEQSIWWVIWGSGGWQWAVQCVLQVFFTQYLAGPQATAVHSSDSFTCISNFLCMKALSITGSLSAGH